MISSSKEKPRFDRRDRWLLLVLRVCGTIDLLALFVSLMPASWIADSHQSMGMGNFPQDHITHYLARSSSLMYAVHGLLLWFVSFDVFRYRPLIRFLAWVALAHGMLLVLIDIYVGMPWWWISFEGPLLLGWGGIVLLLLSRLPTPFK